MCGPVLRHPALAAGESAIEAVAETLKHLRTALPDGITSEEAEGYLRVLW